MLLFLNWEGYYDKKSIPYSLFINDFTGEKAVIYRGDPRTRFIDVFHNLSEKVLLFADSNKVNKMNIDNMRKIIYNPII